MGPAKCTSHESRGRTVLRDHPIICEQDQPFEAALSHQHPIERITVESRGRIAAATLRKATVEPHTWRVEAGQPAVERWGDRAGAVERVGMRCAA